MTYSYKILTFSGCVEQFYFKGPLLIFVHSLEWVNFELHCVMHLRIGHYTAMLATISLESLNFAT